MPPKSMRRWDRAISLPIDVHASVSFGPSNAARRGSSDEWFALGEVIDPVRLEEQQVQFQEVDEGEWWSVPLLVEFGR
jgi:hypothetical protein